MQDSREDAALDTLDVTAVRLHMAAAVVLATATVAELIADHFDRVFRIDTLRCHERQLHVRAAFIVRVVNTTSLDAELLEAADVLLLIEILPAFVELVRDPLVAFEVVGHFWLLSSVGDSIIVRFFEFVNSQKEKLPKELWYGSL